MPELSHFARHLQVETAFDVLAVAQRLKARGKDVIELHIGDSPFPSTAHAKQAAIRAIEDNQTHYCPSGGLPAVREAIARQYQCEFGVAIAPDNVVVGPGAKVFEQFFCEAFLDPNDEVLVFSPHFPTYGPNIARRGARAMYAPLRAARAFRPDPNDVEQFLRTAARPKAIFLNSPHNPTGGVMTAEDVSAIVELVRGRGIALFSDEPYCHMVWQGRHWSPVQWEGMLEQTVAAYTLSKSYSMSGWRIGYAVTGAAIAEALVKMINTSLSCTPPFVQLAAQAALEKDAAERDRHMEHFRRKVHLLVAALEQLADVQVVPPAGTFYVFPDVSVICRRLGITSHGLAMYLLEAADERRGVACLGGECFGPAGSGYLRLSCAEPDERLVEAVHFLAEAVTRTDRVRRYLDEHPRYRLTVRD